MCTIAGFIVVHQPGQFGPLRAGEIHIPPAQIGSIFYGGVFRQQWSEVNYCYYRGSLPSPLVAIKERIRSYNHSYLGIEVCRDLEDALELLRFSRSVVAANEVIAVYSSELIRTKGGVCVGDDLVDWLGVDIVSPGRGSLLENGLFSRPEVFPGWEERLLPAGVLAEDASIEAYIEIYREGVLRGELESIVEPLPGYRVDVVRVGAVKEVAVR